MDAKTKAALKADGQNDIKAVLGKDPLDWPDERLFIYSLIRAIKPDSVVEIGCSNGIGAIAICSALTDNGTGLYYGIDDFKMTYGGQADGPGVTEANIAQEIFKPDLYQIIKTDSLKWLKARKDNRFDVVIVDASHDYKHALGDIREARRVAKDLLLVHDTETEPGVLRAVAAAGGPGAFVQSSRGYWMCTP